MHERGEIWGHLQYFHDKRKQHNVILYGYSVKVGSSGNSLKSRQVGQSDEV